jgi:RND superfamily putative drug exporter
LTVEDAAVLATATAGKSVVTAGTVVLVSISGLLFAGVPGFATMGLAAGLVVLSCVAAAVTVVPALLALLGDRVRGRRGRLTFHSSAATRIAARVVRRPVPFLVSGVLALLALAMPALDMRLGQNDPGAERSDAPTRSPSTWSARPSDQE